MPLDAGHLYFITFNYIVPPHEKICVCICPARPLFFWINSNPRHHGIGQIPLTPAICPVLRYDSVLDLSSVKTGSAMEIQTARDVGEMTAALKALILDSLADPISLLPEGHRATALANLA